MLASQELAEDVAHDCFLGLIRNPKRFDPRRGSLRTYLYMAVRNLVFKQLRRKDFECPIEDAAFAIPATNEGEPLPHLLAQELSSEVRKAIMKIPPPQREALVLFEYEELSLAEIAAITASDISAVKSRLYRARECLRNEMAPYMNGGSKRQRRATKS
jgi:RNA polymerase sigma factor (sigma-70 family)